MLAREIVVVHYEQDLSWLRTCQAPVTVYNKNPDDGSLCHQGVTVHQIPNVGHLDGTYLHHIVTRYDDLADVTLFTQDRYTDHLPPGRHIEELFTLAVDIAYSRVVCCKEWGDDGRIKHWGKWADSLASGAMRRADIPLTGWFRKFLQLEPDAMGSLVYCPGSIFAVRRECIRSRPKRFYALLRDAVCGHANPEEAHYMERSWLHCFWTLGRSIGSLA